MKNNAGKAIWAVLSALTGALFLYSAYTKAFPIHTFENALETYLSLIWKPAAILARTFVGIEAGIGILLLIGIYGWRKWVLKSAFVLLVMFSAFLIYLRIVFGNHVNCGCFGDAIWMSPVAALVKNAILLLIIGLLIRYHQGVGNRAVLKSALVIMLLAIMLPFVLLPFSYKLDMTAMYPPTNPDTPTINLARGKHIIAFVHPFCGYCRKASINIHNIRQKDSTLPLYLMIGGSTSDLAEFWKATGAQDVPHSRLDAAPFLKYTGGSYPLILWVDDGKVVAESGYNDVQLKDVQKWVRK